MRIAVRLLLGLVIVAGLSVGLLYVLGSGMLGTRWDAGAVNRTAMPAGVVAERASRQQQSRASLDPAPGSSKQILFGDLHVHSTFSTDAFMMALPSTGGQGARPVADACDFARYCADLDFWSINDHALALNPRTWRQTVDSIRECNDVAGDPSNPDLVAFLGWEWTQFGTTPDNHYGHKNVILRDLDDDAIPSRPIAARPPADAWDRNVDVLPSVLELGLLALYKPSSSTLDFIRYFRDMVELEDCPDGVAVRDLPLDCRESTLTPRGLFAKLDDWGFESMVIPHGTTWGFYTPHGSAWDKQLDREMHDPERQTLIEVFSGHGNSEEFRDWLEIGFERNGETYCPEPRDDYLPSCWRAGEIVRERCSAAGVDEAECEARTIEARRLYLEGDVFGHLTVPGVEPAEWLDSGQCRDCFQPAFNYRPKSSVQYIMALRDLKDPQGSLSFDFGFIASSDNHTARPGTGYKEYARLQMTEARLGIAGTQMFGDLPPEESAPRAREFEPELVGGKFFALRESERGSSFFLTGGLAAVHAEGRSREQIWDALERREVYGTSGPRILLWFDLLPDAAGNPGAPMGGKGTRSVAPRFRVSALGSFEQEPGCPQYSLDALSAERTERLCENECYNPSDRRRRISRIELVRIAPQIDRRERVANLIDDPWQVLECPPDTEGCSFEVEDPDLLVHRRDILYYARAIEEPSQAVNADLLRCTYDADGNCIAVDPCYVTTEGDCLAETEERAWSSPILVRWQAPLAPVAEPEPAP